MIRKTLIVTLIEKDEHTDIIHDVLKVSQGPTPGTVVLLPLLQGQFFISINDLLDATKEIEAFYSVAPAEKATAPSKPKKVKATLTSKEITTAIPYLEMSYVDPADDE